MSSVEEHDPWAAELGAKLRERRAARGLTLQEVAEQCAVSRSFLSQVERGLVSPSLATLRRIAGALETPMAHFFGAGETGEEASGPERPVIARHQRSRLRDSRAGVTYELLGPAAGSAIEFLWGYFDPGTSAPEPGGWSRHEGDEAYVVVRGSIVLAFGDEEHVMEEGDSIVFDCTRPHRVENRGQTRAELVIAITPPSY